MKIKSTIIASTFGGIMLFGGQAMAAGNASLSLGGGSYQNGSSFAVPVYVDSGTDPVNVVQADFNYDASTMQFQSVSCGGAFTITASTSANDATCGIPGGSSVTGSQLVATINFKALAGSGSSTASIASTSHVYDSATNTDIWNSVDTSTGFSFTSPAPAPSQPASLTTSTSPAATATAPVAPTPTPKATPKTTIATHNTKNTAIVKSSSKGWAWALMTLSVIVLIFLVPAAWLNRYNPKKYRVYKRNTRRFVKNHITKHGKSLYKHGVQFNPFTK